MRPAPPTLLALVTAIALALAGCGGGEGETATSAESTPAPARTQGDQRNPSTEQHRSGGSSAADLPPPTPGSKAPAPGVPTSKEGDNSIQTYGLEASSAERAEATAAVQAYLNARAAGDWAKVCSYLAAKPRAEQERFGAGAPCAKAMASFAAHAQTSVLEEEARIAVLSFRVGNKYAFLIYKRPDHRDYATALTREAGNWKLVSVTPAPVE